MLLRMTAISIDSGGQPIVVEQAWDAYLCMSETKRIYYSFMQSLEQKYQSGGEPSEEEKLQLQEMLQAHGETVATFNQSMQTVVDKDDRAMLLKKMS